MNKEAFEYQINVNAYSEEELFMNGRFEPSFWAKKKESNGVYKWLPLKQHLIDVMEVSGQLWNHWLSEGQKELVISALDQPSEDLANQLVRFIGATHDIAKAMPLFQRKPGYNNSIDLDLELVERLRLEGFDELKVEKGNYDNKSHHALAGQALLTSYGVNDSIASIIGGHHGKPVDDKKTMRDQLKPYAQNYFQSDDVDSPIYKLWAQSQKDLFNWALSEAGFESVAELPYINQAGQVILEGLLIMADWIASNEYYFPLLPLEQYQPSDSEERMAKGWKMWQPTDNWYGDKIENISKGYKERFGYKPRDLQSKLAETIDEALEPGIIIVEAPMGVGKTEAALVAAEQLASKTGRSGIFFGLPTQATSDGIFDRIKKWVDYLSRTTGKNKSIQLVHGNSALNDNFKSIARNIDLDGGEAAGVLVNEWFSGRKTAVLDDFVVGTIDQFLMTALKQKHLALRHLGFSKKVVILDEVHAYDAYMGQYLYKALRWLGEYKVPVIILSATLPPSTRVKLVEEYMGKNDLDWDKEVTQLDNWETDDAYPLITYSDGLEIKQNKDFETPNEKIVSVERISENDLVALLTEMNRNDSVLGVIVNTVKRAQELAKRCADLFGPDKVQLLHSSFIGTDRKEKERKLLNTIGKDAQRPKGQIIIGTQVIEQSLDIDMDSMISDLAPMDLLLQRSGRLHRHEGTLRPEENQEPILYVLGTSNDFEFESGSSAVYGDYLLARTQYFLPTEISLPLDIAKLVHKVYSDEELQLPADLQTKYMEAKKEHTKRIARKEKKAQDYQISDPNLEDDASLIGWLKYAAKINSEEAGSAQVRDIEASIEVLAVKRIEGGYTLFGEEENYAAMLMDGKSSKEIAKQTLRLPRILALPDKINQTIEELERFNQKQLASWQATPWLHGALGIIFDENNRYKLNGLILTYDEQLGLLFEEEE